ncbi:TerB N-terminal domain-containing protein [Gluconacetobacter asukensis]
MSIAGRDLRSFPGQIMFSWLRRIFSGSEVPVAANIVVKEEATASSLASVKKTKISTASAIAGTAQFDAMPQTNLPKLGATALSSPLPAQQAPTPMDVPPAAHMQFPRSQCMIGNDDAEFVPYGQSRSRKKDDAGWVPPGVSVTVHGFEITSGMVYVGNFLTAAPAGGWNADTPAACLIRPSLKVASGPPQTNSDLGYWPSYTDITPNQRLTYLHWLASGKSDTGYPLGYPFLYFYGLERRLVADTPSTTEEALLVAEVERLRSLFGNNGSFASYSTELLNFIQMRRALTDTQGLETWKPDLSALGDGMSPLLRVKLSLHALRGIPLDFDLAMAGILSLPPHLSGLWTRIAMTRARPEFIELTRHRFNQKYPHGFRLRDKKDSRLALTYRSASQYLHASVMFDGLDRLPDPTQLTWTKMTKLCEGAREDLTPFAKVAGKERERADSVAAALMLPPELGEGEAVRAFRTWLNGLPRPVADVPLKELGLRCFGAGKQAAGLRQTRDMSAMLMRLGYGMEPDPTHGGDKPSADVMLFYASDAKGVIIPLSANFHTAALIMAAIGPIAKNLTLGTNLVEDLTIRLRLTPHETARLTARLRLLPERLPTPGRLKAIAGTIEPAQRSTVAALAVSAVATIGEINRSMMVALERLYEAFSLDRRELYAALHRGAAATASYASEPVMVEDGKPQGRGHRIPSPPSKAKSQDGIAIDMVKVGAILRETKEVEEILAPIYEDEVPEIPISAAAVCASGQETSFAGLGAEQARLLEVLVSQSEWTRSGFEVKAHELGLMPDGALEAINEWAYDTFDEELIEDGDPLIINMALLADAPGAAP